MRNSHRYLKMAVLGILFQSCNSGETWFYKQNESKLDSLAFLISCNANMPGFCCTNDNCFGEKEFILMSDLSFECLVKDTSAGTLNFTVKKGNRILEASEVVYLCNENSEIPAAYPNAGISVSEIKDRWFLRVHGYD